LDPRRWHEVGFARSLLAYELPDGRLKLIDGHLRRDLDPDMEVDVEVLDVDDAEARALLLSMDPLAALAETQAEAHRQLLEMTPTKHPELEAAWRTAAAECFKPENVDQPARALPEQFLILIKCRDEKHQAELLERLSADGLLCRALIG